MKRLSSIVLSSVVLLACEAPDEAAPPPPAASAGAEEAPDLSTTEGKIIDAMSAAPPAIASDATIMDWPATEGATMTLLREGTNGWTCLPTNRGVAARASRNPLCADSVMMEWASAYMSQTEPTITGVGLSYMLSGDGGASNIDPYATGPTADNDWVQSGPHLMMVVPDPVLLEPLGTDHRSGRPYVMWSGTPWAHVMIPVPE